MNGNVTNCTLFFNIITTEFNAFATFFWQTVNSTKIEIFCLSLQPLHDSFLEQVNGHHEGETSDCGTENSHWETGQDCMQGGVTV